MNDVLELPKQREPGESPGEPWDVTAEDLRERWNLDNVETIYRWAREGKLPAVKLGEHRQSPVRFRWSDILAFEEEHRLDAV